MRREVQWAPLGLFSFRGLGRDGLFLLRKRPAHPWPLKPWEYLMIIYNSIKVKVPCNPTTPLLAWRNPQMCPNAVQETFDELSDWIDVYGSIAVTVRN